MESCEKRRLYSTRKWVMTQKRRQKKSKKTIKSQSELSDNGTLDGSTAPLSYTAWGRTHQGGSPGDLESDRALSPSVTSNPVTGQQSTGQPITGQLVTDQPITSQQSTGQLITGQPVSGQPVSGQQVTGQPVTGQQITSHPVTSHLHMTFKLNLLLVFHQSMCLYKIMLLL